jgi:hypothetical protein
MPRCFVMAAEPQVSRGVTPLVFEHAGVVNEQIEALMPRLEGLGEAPDRVKVREVAALDLDTAEGGRHTRRDS